MDWSSCESVGSDEEETVAKNKKPKQKIGSGKYARKNVPSKIFNEVDVFEPKFDLGTVFTSKKLFGIAVHSHAFKTWRPLMIKPNDKNRMYVKCLGTRRGRKCPFHLYCHVVKGEPSSFRVVKYVPRHICPQNRKIKNIKSSWIAKKYLSNFMIDPRRKVALVADDIKMETGLNVTRQQVARARRLALEYLYGTEEEQYSTLWNYVDEVKNKNPGSTVLLGLTPEGRFDKMYICLAACKEGFRHCRHIIGVDGCHLKGKYGGILLTAVGIDANNNIYPICWAVVKSETYESWNWFLRTMETNLQLQDHESWTFMSDTQKGLIKAFNENFNESVNRFCVRHLHGNMKTAG